MTSCYGWTGVVALGFGPDVSVRSPASMQVSAEMAGDPQRLSHVQQAYLPPAAWWLSNAGGPGGASESPGGVTVDSVEPEARTCSCSALTTTEASEKHTEQRLWRTEGFFFSCLFAYTKESGLKQLVP